MAAIPRRGRFSTETPLERERRLEIRREQRSKEKRSTKNRGAKRTSRLSTAKATPTTSNEGTGDLNIRGIVTGNPCRGRFNTDHLSGLCKARE